MSPCGEASDVATPSCVRRWDVAFLKGTQSMLARAVRRVLTEGAGLERARLNQRAANTPPWTRWGHQCPQDARAIYRPASERSLLLSGNSEFMEVMTDHTYCFPSTAPHRCALQRKYGVPQQKLAGRHHQSHPYLCLWLFPSILSQRQ